MEKKFLKNLLMLITILLALNIIRIAPLTSPEYYFTEFLLIDVNGSENFNNITVGREITSLNIGLSNYEKIDMNYTLSIWMLNTTNDYVDYYDVTLLNHTHIYLQRIPFQLYSKWEYQNNKNLKVNFENCGQIRLYVLLQKNGQLLSKDEMVYKLKKNEFLIKNHENLLYLFIQITII
jgi:uncharacterized membrane protein